MVCCCDKLAKTRSLISDYTNFSQTIMWEYVACLKAVPEKLTGSGIRFLVGRSGRCWERRRSHSLVAESTLLTIAEVAVMRRDSEQPTSFSNTPGMMLNLMSKNVKALKLEKSTANGYECCNRLVGSLFYWKKNLVVLIINTQNGTLLTSSHLVWVEERMRADCCSKAYPYPN